MSSDGVFAIDETGEMVFVETRGFEPQALSTGFITDIFGGIGKSITKDVAKDAIKTGVVVGKDIAGKIIYRNTFVKAIGEDIAKTATREASVITKFDDLLKVSAKEAGSTIKIEKSVLEGFGTKVGSTVDEPLERLIAEDLSKKIGLETGTKTSKFATVLEEDVLKTARAIDEPALKLGKVGEDAGAKLVTTVEKEVVAAEKGIFGKITGSLMANPTKALLLAGATVIGATATVGIVSAMGEKAGSVTGPDTGSDELETVRTNICGDESSWKGAGVADPAKSLATCRACIVTGKETEKEVVACYQDKIGGAKTPTTPGGGTTPGGYYPGDGGTYPDGGTGAETKAMCDDTTLTADQKKICLDCVALANGSTYDERVKQIQSCFAEKSKTVEQSNPLVLCEDSSFTATQKEKCIACVKAADTSLWNNGADAQKAIIAKIQVCFTAETGGTTADICEDPTLDAATKADCKTCQGKVEDPQDATQLGECIAALRETTTPTPTTGVSPCDDAVAQLSEAEYVACVDCYREGMAIPVLQDCMIDKVAANTGTVPICDATSESYDLAKCLSKVCDPTDALYNLDACDYLMGTVETPYYQQPTQSVDTMDPCDTSSQVFDATVCAASGAEVYTSAPLAEEGASPLVPLTIAGGAIALIVLGFRGDGEKK